MTTSRRPSLHRSLHRSLAAVAALAALGTTAGVAGALGADAATPDSTPAASSATSAAGHHSHVLGHHGVGRLRIGDTVREAREVGAKVGRPPAGGGCRTVTLPGRSTESGRTDGYLAPHLGVVALFARGDMHTPEGIRLGSTVREVKKAYPEVSRPQFGYRTVPLRGHLSYELGFDEHHRVSELLVLDERQPCFG